MFNIFSKTNDTKSSYGSNRLKQKLWALIVMFAMIFSLLPVVPALADTSSIDYEDLYKWTGDGIWGTDITGYDASSTMKFEMTRDFIAFCVDINTGINTSRDYVKVPLDHTTSVAMFTNSNANPDKIRAILTYAWDKTDPDEIAAIQYALWNEMHGTNIPNHASQNIKSIFNKLVSDNETPPIPSTHVNPNNFTLTGPSPNSKPYIFNPSTTDYSFDFSAESGASIVFEVFDENDDEIDSNDYEITDNGSGSYTLTLKNVSGPSNYRLEATTLKDTAVDAYLFLTFRQKGKSQKYEIDTSRSQTVAGIKLSETTQTKSFEVDLHYSATGGFDLSGTKTLSGRDLEPGEFTFELYEGDDTSGDPIETANNDSEGNFSFDTINYTQDDIGSKTYTVVERQGELGGVTYDSNTYIVTVTISDNENGTLTVVPSFGDNSDGIIFNNSYLAAGSIEFSGTKTLTGRELAAGEFTFELYEQFEQEDAQQIRTANNNADGSFSFESISYTQADVGTKTYTIVEQNGELGGVEYDDSVYTMIVNIEDNGDGTLNVYFDEESDDPEAINFTNTYSATGTLDISGTKTLTGRELVAGEFTFELYEGDETGGNPFRTATNDADGNFSFEPISYTHEDVGIKTYTVIEQSGDLAGITYDTNTYTIVISISDNGDGTLAIEPTDASDDPEDITFFNSITTIIIEEEETPLAEPTPAPLPTIKPDITLPLAPVDPTLPTIEVVQEQLPQSGEKAPLWPIGLGLITIAGGMAYLLNRKKRADNN